MSDLHKRSAEEPRTERARSDAASRWRVPEMLEVSLEIATDLRTCSKWMGGDDRGALRVDARRDEILERQEAHPRCGQG